MQNQLSGPSDLENRTLVPTLIEAAQTATHPPDLEIRTLDFHK